MFKGASLSSVFLIIGTTLFGTSYSLKDREGRSIHKAWLLTWEQWMGAMSEAEVNEVGEMLPSWNEAGCPMEFQHSLEMSDGYNLTLGPGIFSLDFFSAL